MKNQATWIVACCLLALLLGGCTSSGSLFHKRSIASQAESDPFPTASQAGLAQAK